MISRRWFRGSVALLALAAVVVTPNAARADTACTMDAGCAKGFTCQMTGISACPPLVACPAGDAGADCVQPVCQPQIVSECEPGPCTTDSDCSDGMVCHPDSVESCATPACPPGQVCAASNVACTTTTISTCVPKYDLPCQVDTDCGPGFNCVPDTVTACSGSGGTAVGVASSGSAGGGASSSSSAGAPSAVSSTSVLVTPLLPAAADAGVPQTPICTTTTTSTSSCVAQTIACSDSAACPSGWTCAPQASAVTSVACAAVESPGGGGTVIVACDAGTPAPAPMQCVPPYYTVVTGSGGVSNALGSGAAQATGGSSMPSTAPASATANGVASTVPDDSAGGCQLASRPAGSSGSFLLALVGLVGLAGRRRRTAR